MSGSSAKNVDSRFCMAFFWAFFHVSEEALASPKVDETATSVAALRLRGLPFSVTVQDVLAFFAQHDVADRIADGPHIVQLLPKAFFLR